ncbi:MAG: hypothetical protein M1596_02070 [Firmicutes bacterium]|jgi:hypothetical protein|nr:hypothetical protein [Bacillota bacterium]
MSAVLILLSLDAALFLGIFFVLVRIEHRLQRLEKKRYRASRGTQREREKAGRRHD